MTRRDSSPSENVSNFVLCRLLFIYWKDLRKKAYHLHKLNFAILGTPRQMKSKKWKSVKLCITHGFSCKLIKRCNLVHADHKHDDGNQSSDILQHSQNRPTGDTWLKL